MNNCPQCDEPMIFKETEYPPDDISDFEKYITYFGAYYHCEKCGIIVKVSEFT